VQLSATLIVLQPGRCHCAITKPLTSQSALAAAIDPQSRGETSQYPFKELKPAVDGFQVSGCDEPESCSRFRVNNYYGYVCMETCIDNGIRIPTGLDLNPMYGFGVMTGIQDRNPSDGGRMRLKRATRPNSEHCLLFICRVAHRPGHLRSRTVVAALRIILRYQRICAKFSLRPEVRKSAAAVSV
jgi:hypothetical protein